LAAKDCDLIKKRVLGNVPCEYYGAALGLKVPDLGWFAGGGGEVKNGRRGLIVGGVFGEDLVVVFCFSYETRQIQRMAGGQV